MTKLAANVVKISNAYQKARTDKSPAGRKISKSEIQDIVRDAKKDGLTRDEKVALVRGFEGFPSSLYGATEKARDWFDRVKKKHDLPEIAIPFYR